MLLAQQQEAHLLGKSAGGQSSYPSCPAQRMAGVQRGTGAGKGLGGDGVLVVITASAWEASAVAEHRAS